jgi:L-asparaginase
VMSYRDAPGYVIDAMVSNGVEGLIIEGTGAGSLTPGQTEAVERAKRKGVIVVATARTQGGRVQDTPRRRAAGIVPGDNLLPEKARILLQLALATTRDPAEIERIFAEY